VYRGGDIARSGRVASPDVAPPDPLPVLSLEETLRVLRRLTPAETERAMRKRILPIAWSPNAVLLAAGSAAAARRAGSDGLRISALIDQDDLLRALQRVYRTQLLREATNGLARRAPLFSASRRLTGMQMSAVALLAVAAGGFLLLSPAGFVFLAGCFFAMFFLGVIAIRIMSLLPPPARVRSAPRELEDDELPQYTVLVPLFRETSVLGQLMTALDRLDYPPDKLDIKLVLEEGDIRMRRACTRLRLPPHMEIILVPGALPQTKPKALAYALPFSRGELLTIFDAEDVPERDQLRLAAQAFAAAPDDVVCLQASLAFYNPAENWLTRQFAIEYAALFNVLLPALAAYGLPLPLGGTSNHFRTAGLRFAGGWDPYNVTEDADLGLRLARLGWRSAMLDARTYEEANCRLGNWLSQRSRWLRGWMQTWLVHMRRPRRLYRELGFQGFLVVQLLMLGVPLSALLHPFFIAATVQYVAAGTAFPALPHWLATLAVGTNVAVFVAGYAVAIAMGRRGLAQNGIRGWTFALATMPFYWLLISLAAWRALWEFIRAPFRWNKTRHGISRRMR
jgi:cellulose synthase/poly-beta-1,6-N-acetylglucosamine synthase-like glycosyltransferase